MIRDSQTKPFKRLNKAFLTKKKLYKQGVLLKSSQPGSLPPYYGQVERFLAPSHLYIISWFHK